MTEIANAPLLETEIDIAAPPEAVWAVVTDLRALGGLSDQVVRTHVRGSAPVGRGTRAVNLNRRGPLVWPTRSKVVRFEPCSDFAFRIKDNGAIWSYELVPTETGTRVVHRREAPNGTSEVSVFLQRRVLGGVEDFDKEMARGMDVTLGRLKAVVEGR